jgi:hypothetical protein
MKIIFIIFATFFILFSYSTSPKCETVDLYRCGQSYGYEYFFGGLLTNGEPVDFDKGSINGWISLSIDTETKEIDIAFKDATKKEKSAKELGASVALVDKDNNDLLVVIRWGKMALETFYFRTDGNGKKHVLYTLLRGGSLSPKGHIFKAECN